jgi:regulator of sigma E protease
MSVFVAILGLAFLILVHEAGHFFVALAVGMRPRKFYVGFPPAIAKVRRKGVEYGIGAIPLGGYVKIPGMHRPSPTDVDVHFSRALREAPELIGPIERVKRRLSASDLPAARAELPAVAEAAGRVQLSDDTRRSIEKGITELEDALGDDAYWRQSTWKRVAAILAGPATNLVFAIALFAVLFMIGGGRATTTVDNVLPGYPAQRAGLMPGDRILAVDGRPIDRPAEIPERISASKGKPVILLVQRGGRTLPLDPVRPRPVEGTYRLGFVLAGEGLGFGEASWEAFKLTGIVTREIGKSLARLVHGEGRKDISSPVGIVQGSSDALKEGVQTYLWVLGLISLSLALLNLLPLLPLDGGHIAFSIVEGVRGRALRREIYERVSVIGIALVLFLFFIGLSNDIGRLDGS